MEQLQGKVLDFRQKNYDAEQAAWTRITSMLPRIATLYNNLGIGEFDDKAFTMLKRGQRETIVRTAEAQMEKAVERLKMPVLSVPAKENLHKMLNELFKEWAALEEAKNINSRNVYEIYLDWDEVSYKDGRFVVDQTASRERYETRIENEDEATMYQLAMEAKDAFDKLGSFLKDRGVITSQYRIVNSNGGVFWEADNQLHFSPGSIKVAGNIKKANGR